jgi:hypothetical protein
VITFSVIHVPSDRRVISFLSRGDGRALVRWLARDVPHLEVDADGHSAPAVAFDRLREIVAAATNACHYRYSIARLMRDPTACAEVLS